MKRPNEFVKERKASSWVERLAVVKFVAHSSEPEVRQVVQVTQGEPRFSSTEDSCLERREKRCKEIIAKSLATISCYLLSVYIRVGT